MSWLDKFLGIRVALGGTALPQEGILNLLGGVSAVDNPGTGSTDVTVNGDSRVGFALAEFPSDADYDISANSALYSAKIIRVDASACSVPRKLILPLGLTDGEWIIQSKVPPGIDYILVGGPTGAATVVPMSVGFGPAIGTRVFTDGTHFYRAGRWSSPFVRHVTVTGDVSLDSNESEADVFIFIGAGGGGTAVVTMGNAPSVGSRLFHNTTGVSIGVKGQSGATTTVTSGAVKHCLATDSNSLIAI